SPSSSKTGSAFIVFDILFFSVWERDRAVEVAGDGDAITRGDQRRSLGAFTSGMRAPGLERAPIGSSAVSRPICRGSPGLPPRLAPFRVGAGHRSEEMLRVGVTGPLVDL